MHFIDSTEVDVKSGRGGNGMVSFKTANNKPKLGPDGGDGGSGGDVIIVAHDQMNTLSHLRYQRRFAAGDGDRGGSSGKTGATGLDVEVAVPLGTEIYDAHSGELLCEILYPGQRECIAKGGHRGLGNLRFLSSTHQAPYESTLGGPSIELNLRLELKLLADVGLAGLPNAGKSTLLSVLSAARPRIADYPFTTLTPNLGVVELSERGEFSLQSFVMADVPGLIEGASEGRGLGHAFLRHLERTKVIGYVVEAFPLDGVDPIETLELLRRELFNYEERLAQRRSVVIFNKIDLASDEEHFAELARLKTSVEAMGLEVFTISAAGCLGLVSLKERLFDLVTEERKKSEEATANRTPWAKGLKPAGAAGIADGGLVDFMSALQAGRAFVQNQTVGFVH